jgi:hypothetical protein
MMFAVVRKYGKILVPLQRHFSALQMPFAVVLGQLSAL